MRGFADTGCSSHPAGKVQTAAWRIRKFLAAQNKVDCRAVLWKGAVLATLRLIPALSGLDFRKDILIHISLAGFCDY
jgi:hypothetical protein